MAEAKAANRKLKRLFRHAFVFLFIPWISVTVMLAALQRSLMYVPRTGGDYAITAWPELQRIYEDSTNLTITTDDQIPLGGWYLKHSEASASPSDERHLILFFHGNGGDRTGRIGWYRLFASLGVDVLAIDYRGYGDSAGQPSEIGLKLDALAAWDYATETLHYRPDRIIVFGVSLGGAVAVNLAHQVTERGNSPAALVLVATFSSMVDVASYHYWWLPVRLVLQDRYASASDIKNLSCPLLQFHGDQDTVVPYHFGERLFAAAPDQSVRGIPKQWVRLAETEHNGLAELHADQLLPPLQDLVNQLRDRSAW